MSETELSIGERIRRRRTALRMSQKRLAGEVTKLGINLSQQNVNSIESGAVQRPRALPEIAKVLLTTIEWLQKGSGPEEFGTPDKPERKGRYHFELLPSAHTSKPYIIELIPRQRYGTASLIEAGVNYSFYMSGNEMSPVIEDGDEIGVYPGVAPERGMDCVFLQREANGKCLVTVARLVSRIQTEWLAMHFNPEAHLHLSRDLWIAAHPIASIRRARVINSK